MCKKNKNYLLVAAGILALFPFAMASADTVTGAGGSWQPASSWSQSQLAVDAGGPNLGTPYWNNASGDGPKGNIGWCLMGGSTTCTMAGSPGSTLPYWGTAAGASVPNMFFTSSGVPLLFTVDGIHTNETVPNPLNPSGAFDVFGYYMTDANGNPTGSLHPLFNTNSSLTGNVLGSPASVGSTTLLSLGAGAKYGLYIENIKGYGTVNESDYIFEMSGQNQELGLGPDGLQHFAIFQTTSGYIIGDQDGVGCTNNAACVAPVDFDFNNFIVTTSAVPEPGTIGLMGASFLLLGGFLRKKLQRRD